MKNRRKTPLDSIKFDAESCSNDARLKILHDLPFFKGLTREDIINIHSFFKETHYNKEETIYFSGEESTQLCIIAAGSVKLIKHSYEGQDTLIDILKQGEFFGTLDILGQPVYQETAETQTNACIMKIDSRQFRAVLQKYPLAAINLIDIISERLKSANEMKKQLSVQNVEQRIAFTLLKLADKAGQQKDLGLLIQFPLSRNDLAGMTGTTTETASRIMSHFQKKGIIKTGRQWVAITNRKQLEQLSGYKS